jgi:hypothetical protein
MVVLFRNARPKRLCFLFTQEGSVGKELTHLFPSCNIAVTMICYGGRIENLLQTQARNIPNVQKSLTPHCMLTVVLLTPKSCRRWKIAGTNLLASPATLAASAPSIT